MEQYGRVMTVDPSRLEAALQLSFRDRELLRLALTHSSFVNEHPEEGGGSNERLEFLGDAVLDFVVAEELYQRFPERTEGELTALRAALVSGQALAPIGLALELGDYLSLGQGEEASGGRTRASTLAAALEALVGAVLLDLGYPAARGLILRLLKEGLEDLARAGVPKDPKSLLQELVQGQGKPPPVYQTVDEQGPDHAKQFVVEALVEGQVVGRGSGPRKVEAERAAALAALDSLRQGAGG
jgi:ribonuclease-3